MGEGGVKNPEKLPTSFKDGPLPKFHTHFDITDGCFGLPKNKGKM